MQLSTSSSRDIRSAGDLMRERGLPAKPADYVTGKVIKKKTLTGLTRYSYCPFCYRRAKKAGQNYKEVLNPLWVVTYKNLYRFDDAGNLKIIYETEYECPVCRERDGSPKRITLDDFLRAYSEPFRNSEKPFLNINDKEALKRAGFEEFAAGI